MQIMIDCYGHPAASERFQRENFRKRPYLVDRADDSTTYLCFDAAPRRAIHRISVNENVTEIKWAFGSWEDREFLDYSATLNEPLPVDETDIG